MAGELDWANIFDFAMDVEIETDEPRASGEKVIPLVDGGTRRSDYEVTDRVQLQGSNGVMGLISGLGQEDLSIGRVKLRRRVEADSAKKQKPQSDESQKAKGHKAKARTD